MPVKVNVHGNRSDDHPDAQHILVKEGHLHVLAGPWANAAVHAIYAPGSWQDATATENPRK